MEEVNNLLAMLKNSDREDETDMEEEGNGGGKATLMYDCHGKKVPLMVGAAPKSVRP